ncbi:MAG: hypothetical protein AAFN77_08035 [Planctomycetota bacterium]
MEPILKQRIRPTIWRTKFRRTTLSLAVVWVVCALIAVVMFLLNQSEVIELANLPTLLFWGTAAMTCLALFTAWSWPVTDDRIVKSIEDKYPDLDSALITASEIAADGETSRLGFLQMDVLRRAVAHSYEHRWSDVVPGWQLFTFPIAGLIGLIAFFIAMIGLTFFSVGLPEDLTIPFASAAVDQQNIVISIEPGNTEAERGTSLLVLARFPEGVPTDATLVYSNGDETVRVPMLKSLDDPIFGGRIDAIETPLTYHVEFGPSQTERSIDYKIEVFEFPALVRADALLTFPEYTNKTTKTVQDVRRVTAVEGTELSLDFFVNKSLATATLIPAGKNPEGESISLTPDRSDPRKFVTSMTLETTKRYRLILQDDQQRSNRVPPTFSFNVVKNRPPSIKVVAPGRDTDASALEEVQLAAEGFDDFGVTKFGLSYMMGGEPPTDLELESKETKSTGKSTRILDRAEHLLALESLQAKPDDLVSYYFWLEDIAPNGKRRRVSSDLFFIEVRRFDEIFRQGEAPPGQQQQQQQQQQQSQSGQQAGQLAEIQKQIMTSTWNLQRRITLEPAQLEQPEFARDTDTLVTSQLRLIDQLKELAGELQDPTAQGIVSAVEAQMTDSATQLQAAKDQQDGEPLSLALSSQQSAYQGLLKMRAKENEVMQQQQQQQSQSQSQNQNNRQQQQLDQLNIEQDRNRYEEEKKAQDAAETDAQADADREILNRLKELARRQEDINERIKELITALEESKSAAEQEEIERRLKSLREQQQKMLRDADELLEDMNQEENRDRMSQEAEQLAETREGLRQTSEALENKEMAQAAAEGTRAQQELENLRDEFKKRNAGQFNERMRQMRNQVQDIEKKQSELSDSMQQLDPDSPTPATPKLDDDQPKSLRDTNEEPPTDLEDELRKQQAAVEELRQKMRETIEESEDVEPLLAESLYETYRNSETNRPDVALETSRRSLARGWMDDAIEQSEQAEQGIAQLREGIEEAAEQVLGDETEALKAAEESLEQLNDAIRSELDSNGGDEQKSSAEPNQQKGANPSESNGSTQSENNDPNSSPNESNSNEPSDSQNPNGAPNDMQQPAEDQDQQESQSGNGTPSGRQGDQEASDPQQQSPQASGNNNPDQPSGESSDDQKNQPPNASSQPGNGQGGSSEEPDSQSNQASNRDQMNDLMEQLGGQTPTTEPTGQPQNNNDNSAQNIGSSRTLNAGNQRMKPISGDDFKKWYDELRDVEEMLDDPDLRAEASRIREQAREIRKEFKQRHSAEPNWDLVQMKIAKPLQELQQKVADEILRRTSKDARVPINREPVPVQYEDAVRQYYQRLGVGK